jgi:hypothetical protein
LKAELKGQRECSRLDTKRRYATEKYLAEQSYLLGVSCLCLQISVVCFWLYIGFVRFLVRLRALLQLCSNPRVGGTP